MTSLIAKKSIDFNMTNNMLYHCSETNMFTNSNKQYVHKLEKYIHKNFKIDDTKAVICTMSGDGALHCLISAFNIYHNKKLKWCTQSFTFPSSACGILKDAIIIDIDEEGSLDLNKIDDKIIDNIDGIIVTNVFGNVCDIQKYEKWCNIRDKILVFDNAATSYSFYKNKNSCNYGIGSIISFHHTKPFGFGEGGAIIIDKKFENIIRITQNFGIDNSDYLKKNNWNVWGANYKMSEISAIYILQYLKNNFYKIIEHHKMLYSYIKNNTNCILYPNFSDDFPVVSCISILNDIYDNNYIEQKIKCGLFCRKYYNPLINSDIALKFYKKILCIPCNIDIDIDTLTKYLIL